MSALTKGIKLIEAHRTAESYERMKLPDGAGWKRVRVGFVSGKVEVWVNPNDMFAQLASKALRSANGKSRAMKGAVIAVVRNRKREAP